MGLFVIQANYARLRLVQRLGLRIHAITRAAAWRKKERRR